MFSKKYLEIGKEWTMLLSIDSVRSKFKSDSLFV